MYYNFSEEQKIFLTHSYAMLKAGYTHDEIVEYWTCNDQEKVENIVEETFNEAETSFSEEAINSSDTQNQNSNDLKEFGVDMDEPDLFSSENKDLGSENLFSSSAEDEEDDLEIPAFLRRQKN